MKLPDQQWVYLICAALLALVIYVVQVTSDYFAADLIREFFPT